MQSFSSLFRAKYSIYYKIFWLFSLIATLVFLGTGIGNLVDRFVIKMLYRPQEGYLYNPFNI